jgi:1,2-diacylglycerol 3-beta-glucosyltransferase
MDLLFELVQLPFLALGVFLAAYIVILTAAALMPAKKHQVTTPTQKKFAIIIPSHNEEGVIEQTLFSTQNLQYPSDLFDVIVVADNCTDGTAKIAMANGAIVFERFDEKNKGKSAALNWVTPKILDRLPRYDACVFIDADTVVSPNFLLEMNISLHHGHQIIQGGDLVLENSSAWRVQLALIAIALQNYVRPLGKVRLGLSTTLKGNGMCFASELLRTLQWDEQSLTEDLDMALELIRHGHQIYFNPRAVVRAIMPASSSGATTQRLRWEGGRFNSVKTKVPELLREAWKKKNLQILDAAIDTGFPPLVLFTLISLGFVVFNGLLLWWKWVSTDIFLWGWLLIILSLVAHCIAGIFLARVHPRNLLAFLYIPRFFIWKIGVYIKMVGRKGATEWVRTAR